MADAWVQGVTAEDFRITNAVLTDGRLFTDVDDLHRRDAVVIGADVVQRLFLNEDPIGKQINADGHTLEVIGTLAKRKAFLGDNNDDKALYLPYFTYRSSSPTPRRTSLPPWPIRGRWIRRLMK